MFIVIIKPILVFVSQGFIFYFLKEECIMALSMNLSPEKIGKILDVVNGMSPAEIRSFLQEKTGLTASDDEIKRTLDFLNKHRAKPLTDADLESAAGGLSKGQKQFLNSLGGALLGTILALGVVGGITQYAKNKAQASNTDKKPDSTKNPSGAT